MLLKRKEIKSIICLCLMYESGLGGGHTFVLVILYTVNHLGSLLTTPQSVEEAVTPITNRYNQGVEFMFRQSEDTCIRLPVDSGYAVGVDVELTMADNV